MRKTQLQKLKCLTAALLLVIQCIWADSTTAQFYAHKYAVVIGINEYRNRDWPRLAYARNDAQGVGQLMKQLGFIVYSLYDNQATKTNILALLEDKLAPSLGKRDALLFFFAGHGTTKKLGGKNWGYIVPYDATQKSSSLISMEEIRTLSQKMGNAKHQAFIMDCCYGGLMSTRNVKIPESHTHYLQEIGKRTARQILTAGGKDQVVADGGPNGHSVFTGYLIKGLGESLADLNGDGWITFNELSSYLQDAASSPVQTPGAATLPGHEQGDFLFPASQRVTEQTPELTEPFLSDQRNSSNVSRDKASQAAEVSGEWNSVFGKVIFKQDGMRVEGLLVYADSSQGLTATIEGTFRDSTLKFSWWLTIDPNGRKNPIGHGTLQLSQDGKTLSGHFSNRNYPETTGLWVLTRR